MREYEFHPVRATLVPGRAAMCWYMPLVGALLILNTPVRSLRPTAARTRTLPSAAAGRSRRQKQADAANGARATARTAFSPPSHDKSAVTAKAPTDAPRRSAK